MRLLMAAAVAMTYAAAPAPAVALTALDVEARACVRIGNGGGCSGVIIASDDTVAYGVSAAHCTSGVGGEMVIGTIDGGQGKGRWVAVDRSLDMAIFKCWAKDVLGVAPVRSTIPQGKFDGRAIGFPQTVGPNVKDVTVARSVTFSGGMQRNAYTVKNGKAYSGDSGGGVFVDGHLVGIISHMPTNGRSVSTNGPNGGSPELYASTNDQLVKFVRSYQSRMTASCRNNWCWTPQPNRNIDTSPLPRIPDLDTDDRRQQALQNVFDLLDGIDDQISGLNQEVAGTQSALDELTKRLDKIEQSTQSLAAKVDSQGQSLDQITEILQRLAKSDEAQDKVNASQDAALLSLQAALEQLAKRPITVEILDRNGKVIDRETYPAGQPIKLQFGEE